MTFGWAVIYAAVIFLLFAVSLFFLVFVYFLISSFLENLALKDAEKEKELKLRKENSGHCAKGEGACCKNSGECKNKKRNE